MRMKKSKYYPYIKYFLYRLPLIIQELINKMKTKPRITIETFERYKTLKKTSV